VSELVELASYQNRTEAELARLNLEAEGIEVVLFGAEMGSLGLGPLLPIRLMVPEEELRRARQILAE
jgi:hypothetical protein